MKNVVFACLYVPHQIEVVGRKLQEMITVFLADPENQSAIRNLLAVDDGSVGHLRGHEKNVPMCDRESFFSKLNTDVAFQKKIKFIIVVCMQIYF